MSTVIIKGPMAAIGITVNIDWGEVDGSTSTITSATRILSGTGTLLFGVTNIQGNRTVQYSKNGGAFTTFVDGGTLSISNNDTLAFRMISVFGLGDEKDIIVTDNASGSSVGTCNLIRAS